MAVNIRIGPQGAIGLDDVSFADANMVAANTNEIIRVTPDGYLFFNPNNGSFPQFEEFEEDGDYLINSKITRDLSAVVYTGGGNGRSVWVDDDNTAFADADGRLLEI